MLSFGNPDALTVGAKGQRAAGLFKGLLLHHGFKRQQRHVSAAVNCDQSILFVMRQLQPPDGHEAITGPDYHDVLIETGAESTVCKIFALFTVNGQCGQKSGRVSDRSQPELRLGYDHYTIDDM